MLSSKRCAVATIPVPSNPYGVAVSPDGRGLIDGVSLIDRASLTQVPESQTQIITNLMQLYKNDFLEFAWVGSRYGEVGPDARFT